MHPQRPPLPTEQLLTSMKDVKKVLPTSCRSFVYGLVPFAGWIQRYNLNWFVHDLIAGITIGLVVIPQSIAYATTLALLPPQYGLYTAFISVIIYSVFSTSKDATPGPTSIISLLIAQNIAANIELFPTIEQKVVFAATVAFWSGVVQVVMGVCRLGIIVEFIPAPVIAGFSTGAGLQSVIAQLPSLFGIKGVATTDAPYLVLVNFFKNLHHSQTHDVVFGISSLCFLILLKHISSNPSTNNNNHKSQLLKYISVLRNAITILVFTGISYAGKSILSANLVSQVPFGLSGLIQPKLDSLSFTTTVLKSLPGIVIASLLEHIAVTKTYGRLNGYTCDENQEIFALGMSNLLGSFVGAYTVSASFSRSAIQSSSGVKTPLASMFTGLVVIVALFSITPALFYIPTAVLAAIIISATAELFVSFKTANHVLGISLPDFVGFYIAFLVSCFVNIQVAIFTAVGFSLLVLLVRIARPQFTVLSRRIEGKWVDMEGVEVGESGCGASFQDVQVPEGILVFRPEESVTYPNSAYILSCVRKILKEGFRYTGIPVPKEDRVWCDDMEERMEEQGTLNDLPRLRAVVIDFSSVNHIDYSGMQTLLDAKQDLEKYAGTTIPFHFAHVRTRHLNTVWCIPSGTSVSDMDMTPVLCQDKVLRFLNTGKLYGLTGNKPEVMEFKWRKQGAQEMGDTSTRLYMKQSKRQIDKRSAQREMRKTKKAALS
ncbi:UNVERIFIED_CONTAM: hypothetical protein HDU68_005857 [Siphonaria sp. JEL0065]|nr:hypothetical protein HDU68_005857 [Siphonaria sp. JEL0065]